MNEYLRLETGRYGPRAVLTGSWSDGLRVLCEKHRVIELEINQANSWKGNDLSFLSVLPGLVSFEIFDFNIRNIEPVHCLHNLKRLGITTYCSTEIKFSAFPLLEECGLEWRPRAVSLFDCKTVRKLFINRYKGKDTLPFSRLANLESLAILNAPIGSLSGLTTLRKLRSLRLAGLTRLHSLAGIEELKCLEELEIHTCRRIGSIEQIGELTRLRKLNLNNDGKIDSFKPLAKLTALELVSFYESTEVVDGDLSPLAGQTNLRSVSFQNRRHYSHRREDLSLVRSGRVDDP